MNLKLRRELEFSLSFNTLIKKDYGVTIELVSLVSNVKKKVSSVLDSFLSFMKKYMNEKNKMLALMLDPSFKTLCSMFSFKTMLASMLDPRFKNIGLVFSFISLEEGIIIVEEYDTKSLYPMLLKISSFASTN